MACLPVTYALCWLVMASSASEAKEEETNKIIFPRKNGITFSKPSEGMNRSVIAGRNITFVCSTVALEGTVDIQWFNHQTIEAAYVRFSQNKCKMERRPFPNLSVEDTDCKDGLFQLRITNIDTSFQGAWYCLITTLHPVKRYRSQDINLHVLKYDSKEASTTQGVLSSSDFLTTRTSQTSVKDSRVASTTQGVLSSSDSFTTQTTRTSVKENTNVHMITDSTSQLIGGTAGGALALLAVCITVCFLLRSRRERNTADDGPASTDNNRDAGENAEDAIVMEESLMYGSCGAGNDDYAQIPCRESASASVSHEKEDASVLKNQPDTEDRNTNQSGVDSADIYAVPDKPKKSTVEEPGGRDTEEYALHSIVLMDLISACLI